MKVAILSESPPDEAAITILVGAVLGSPITRVESLRLRSRGWPSVRSALPGVILHLHYRTDAAGLIVVVDSDSPIAHREVITEAACQNGCRLCELRLVTRSTLQRLSARPVRTLLKVAVGLAVPAIEAWYRVGVDGTVTEATWIQAHAGLKPRLPYTKLSLKQDVYGTDRPPSALSILRATEEARRLSIRLQELSTAFPGFRVLSDELSTWHE
jgi:hypothetical protein